MRPDPRMKPPTAQTEETNFGHERPDRAWLQRAKSAYYNSTNYVDTNYRKQWEDSIRAFNNQHPNDSKYVQASYDKRSKIYRPKTRTVIRKNEAAAAAAYFSNMDVVNVRAQDQTNKQELASAAFMKELLQYRLTKTIPWYQLLLGGLQDAQTVGAAIAHIYWEYQEEQKEGQPDVEVAPPTEPEDEEYPQQNGAPRGASVFNKDGEQPSLGTGLQEPEEAFTKGSESDFELQEDAVRPGQPEINVKHDRPVIDLVPIENIRFDPGANWIDPINSSPYVIHLIPMYVVDVKERMERGEWRRQPDSMILAAVEAKTDSTRVAREPNKDDRYGQDNNDIDDYMVVWIHRHIHRKDGEDYEFYMLGDLDFLTKPRPIKETVFHGRRPYVLGVCNLETHKVIPTPLPILGRSLQDEANEIANQRLDNVKFILNKKFFVKRGREADVQGLLRNVPGGVVMLDDPEHDVKEMNWNDVTASAFEEQNRINMDMDELMGNFNPSQIMSQAAIDTPAKNMAMLKNSNGTLVEYLLRTYTETFVQPVLRQLILLEQEYETDEVVMKLAGKNANLLQLYGIDQVTDSLLVQELTLTVNVGMGTTDPMAKLQKFMTAMQGFIQMVNTPIPGLNLQEVGKEIFGHLGYADGSRFFTTDNPQVAKLQGELQKAQQLVQQLSEQIKDKQMGHQVKAQLGQLAATTALEKAKLHEENENKRALATHWNALMGRNDAIDEAKAKHEHEMERASMEHAKAAHLILLKGEVDGRNRASKPSSSGRTA